MFDQKDFNNIIRDVNLSKESLDVLASQLRPKNLLGKYTKVNLFRNRDAKFIVLFNKPLKLVYCSVIKEVLLMLDVGEYDLYS